MVDGLFEAVVEGDAVAQPGEGVEVGQASCAGFGFFLLGDIDRDRQAAHEVPLPVVFGDGRKEYVDALAVLAHQGIGDVVDLPVAEELGEGALLGLET